MLVRSKASDKQAFATAAAEAYSSIRKSRADSFREQLAEAHGDQRTTWRVANRLLHSKPPTYYSDDDCAHLSSTFSQFFIDKLKNIGDNIAANLTSTAAAAPVTRSYSGPQFDGSSLLSWPTCPSVMDSSRRVSRSQKSCHCSKSLVLIGQFRRITGRYPTSQRSLRY